MVAINFSLTNPGLLIFLIYLPIILLLIDKNFRKRFSKVHSTKLGILLEVAVGILYFLMIVYAATLKFNNLSVFTIGIFIYLIGLIITLLGYHTFFISKPGIIKKFPYNISRNPTYFFGFIAILGIAITTSSTILFLLLLIQFTLTYKIILQEEEFLLRKFKKQYQDYSKTVRRYI
tara:strand:+ start:583 stop:1110 length:528 start_codon:yes stop_codon:yes gene_type:complete